MDVIYQENNSCVHSQSARSKVVHVLKRVIPKRFRKKIRVKINNYRINHNWYTEPEKEILKWKDVHKNETAFIVGNGPSLRARDLEIIKEKGYYTFASNKIYKIYEETTWRPDYYACIDREVYIQNIDDILTRIQCPMLLHYKCRTDTETWVEQNARNMDNIMFSNYHYIAGVEVFRDQVAIVESGGSVTFTLLEMAWMMGFRKMYLIGCDHNYASFTGKEKGKIIIADQSTNNDYFVKNYIKPGEHINVGDLDKLTRGYLVARNYIESHGGEIYNATRGGNLNVFERVDLEKVLM